MATILDQNGSNSIAASTPNLIANFQAAAVTSTITPNKNGLAVVDWQTRLPLVMAVLKSSIEDHSSIRMTATLNPGTDNQSLGTIEFGAFAEKGASLPLYCPIIVQGGLPVPAFSIQLTPQTVTEAGVATNVAAKNIADLIDVVVVEGNIGRLLYNLNAEKMRMRRMARQIHASRQIDFARLDSLDRIGADLGIARCEEEIFFDKPSGQVLSRHYMQGGIKVMEPDSDYAARLKIYQPFLMPSRKFLEARLNGSSEDQALMPIVGYDKPVTLQETQNTFAVAIQLVDVQAANRITNFLNYVRDAILIFPANIPANNTRHAGRPLPSITASEVLALRNSIRQNFTIPNDLGLAPMLAGAIDRAGRVTKALGVNIQWTINKAFDPAGGSRYQMGLGLDVVGPTGAQIDQLLTDIASHARAITSDQTAEALIRDLQAMTIPSNADDPNAAWFWNVAGLQTVHKTSAGPLYLSHLPTFGLAISGPTAVNNGANIGFQGNYHAPGDPGSNALLVEIQNAAQEEWASSGNPAWTLLSDANAATLINAAVQLPAASPVYAACSSAGCQMFANNAVSIPQLKAIPTSLFDVIKLPPALSTGIMANNAQSVRQFSQLVTMFQRLGLAAMATLVNAANEIHLVLSITGLPEVGLNLGERRSSGLRWYVVPIGGTQKGAATIDPFGSAPNMHGTHAGLVAVVCLGYVRRDFADPYEFRVLPTEGNLLNLHQYEFLMNFLEQTFPIGIEVNTFELRKFFVDLHGNGAADPLSTNISKTYRKYYNPRMRGIYTNEEKANG